MLEILRQQSSNNGEEEEEKEESEEKLIYMTHKNDDLEAIVWQLYDAGFRPNIKNGAGKLSWVSLTVNNCTFIIKSQQLIDWAIDGMLEVEDAGVFNRLQDAKQSSTISSSSPTTGATTIRRTSRSWTSAGRRRTSDGCTSSRE
jgi:hypothetical protein